MFVLAEISKTLSPPLLDEGERKPRRKRGAKIRATSRPPDDPVDETAKTRDPGSKERPNQPSLSSVEGGLLAIGKPEDCRGCSLALDGEGYVPLTYLDTPLTRMTVLRPSIRLLVQGEAPGRNEADKGAAFIGDAGFWVRKNILHNAGVLETEVLFDNTLRCLPPKNKKGEFYPTGEARTQAEQHCRRYDRWHEFPGVPLLLVGGKAMEQRLGVASVSDWHGHVEPREGRMVGCTYHPAAVMRQPNLLPIAIRETANLLTAASNPRVLVRPQVVKGVLPSIGADCVFDLEWNPVTNVLTAVGLAYESDRAYSSYNVEEGLAILRQRIDEGSRVIGHNIIDADLPRIGMTPKSWSPEHVIDTILVAHLIHAHFASLSLLDLGGLTRFYFPTSNWKHDTTDLLQYNGYDCAYNFRLWEALKRDLDATEQWHLVEKQQKLAHLTVQMHQRGVRLDGDGLRAYFSEREEQRRRFRENFPINPNSPKQIVSWAESLGIRVSDAQYETIVKHRGKNVDFDALIDYREDAKSLKTWFPIETDRKGNLLGVGEWSYPHFNVTGTDVARFSCSDPNYQNLPPHLRRFIIPRSPELEIVAFDFSQIENRCVAWLAKDEQMLADFASGLDIHRLIASRIFRKRYDDIDGAERKRGKITVHASNYGETHYNLAKRIAGNQRRDALAVAKGLQDSYFSAYPKTREWQRKVAAQLDTGNVMLRSPFGRVRFVYARNSHERMKRGCHFLGCSTAADIVNERALWAIDALRQRLGELATPILIVHDEVVWEMPKGDAESQRIAKEVLETAVSQLEGLVIPTKAKIGPNYGELVEHE